MLREMGLSHVLKAPTVNIAKTSVLQDISVSMGFQSQLHVLLGFILAMESARNVLPLTTALIITMLLFQLEIITLQ